MIVNCKFEGNPRVKLPITLAKGIGCSLESYAHYFLPPLLMSYVVASNVKELVNSKDMMSSGDLAEHLSKHIEMWLGMGVKAAQANDRKTVRGSDMLAFHPGKTTLVVASKVKEFINGKNMMSSGDLSEHISGLAEWLLTEAIKRAGANGRKTVRGEDL